MKKNKKRIILFSSLVIVIIVAFVSVMIYLNNSQNNYTFLEKKWIGNKTNEIIDLYIEKDLPVFSLNGSGVFYDLSEDLSIDTGLSFNISSTNNNTISLMLKKDITENDIVVYKDNYVLISKTGALISNIGELESINVGVLNTEISNISYYLTNYTNVTYKTYNTMEDLEYALKEENISYVILPYYENLELILEKGYNIVYHFNGLNKYYVINFNNIDNELKSIVTKFYNKWKEEKENSFNENILNLYYTINDYTELEKESIINDDFIVGYINNLPFEGKINTTFSGITHTYLDGFEKLTGATYKYVEYKSLDKLENALNEKKVDIVYNAYGINNSNYNASSYLGNKEVVVLVHESNDLTMDSIYALSKKEVLMLSNTNLKNIYTGKNIFTITDYENLKKIFKNMDRNSIILIEKEVYDYYKNSSLKHYKEIYSEKVYTKDNFLISNTNSALNKLFNFYIESTNYENMSNKGVYHTLSDVNANKFLSFILKNIIYIIILLILLGYSIYKIGKRVRISKKIKKEDRLLYLDVMTNLKNRNYLNDNIEYWEQNIIYPQTIVILDLNSIKNLNDKFGHTEGDKQIKACANVLIKTQRENSEIMRSDGNEFTIYLVGYEEKMITSYIHKLNKELKNALPYKDYGVAIGYSMITDKIKTIDDAINEATIMVNENKEIKNNGENKEVF